MEIQAKAKHRMRLWFAKPSSSSLLISGVAVGVAALIGIIDWLTTPQLSLALFYLVPIALAIWYAGRTQGFLVALVCGLVWLIADLGGEVTFKQPWIPYFNACVRTAVFLIVAGLVVKMKDLTATLESRVKQRTQELEQEIANRGRVEAQLRESEGRFRQMTDSITQMFHGNIDYHDTAYGKIANCWLINGFNNIHLGAGAQNCHISDNYLFRGVTMTGTNIAIKDGDANTIVNNMIASPAGNVLDVGINLDRGANGNQILNNNILAGRCVWLSGDSNTFILGNNMNLQNIWPAVCIYSDASSSTPNSVKANRLNGGYNSAIWLSGVGGWLISENNIFNGRIHLAGSADNKVANNLWHSPDSAGTCVHSTLATDTSNWYLHNTFAGTVEINAPGQTLMNNVGGTLNFKVGAVVNNYLAGNKFTDVYCTTTSAASQQWGINFGVLETNNTVATLRVTGGTGSFLGNIGSATNSSGYSMNTYPVVASVVTNL